MAPWAALWFSKAQVPYTSCVPHRQRQTAGPGFLQTRHDQDSSIFGTASFRSDSYTCANGAALDRREGPTSPGLTATRRSKAADVLIAPRSVGSVFAAATGQHVKAASIKDLAVSRVLGSISRFTRQGGGKATSLMRRVGLADGPGCIALLLGSADGHRGWFASISFAKLETKPASGIAGLKQAVSISLNTKKGEKP